ncbi:MAG: hypothetical protein C5B45_04630 [Chlamydiae bacterium]|nr:MAG: hypothetical protein C5B45_04630 [Chlamydiota bacterium]
MQTASRNAASIFIVGTAGWMAGRITGAISPRDGAILSAAGKVSNIFIDFIENRFVKEPLMSDADEEKGIRLLARVGLHTILVDKICSLANARKLQLSVSWMKFACTEIVITLVFKKIAHTFFLL